MEFSLPFQTQISPSYTKDCIASNNSCANFASETNFWCILKYLREFVVYFPAITKNLISKTEIYLKKWIIESPWSLSSPVGSVGILETISPA